MTAGEPLCPLQEAPKRRILNVNDGFLSKHLHVNVNVNVGNTLPTKVIIPLLKYKIDFIKSI